MASPLRIQPDVVPDIVKDAKIHAVPLQATAREAGQRMAMFCTGALVVLEAGGALQGL